MKLKIEWVSVKRKLPEHEQTVLCRTIKNSYAVCIYVELEVDGKIQISFCSKEIPGNVLGGVTHWIPLPKVYKDKT
jgi:uncharacterized protein DUF551